MEEIKKENDTMETASPKVTDTERGDYGGCYRGHREP